MPEPSPVVLSPATIAETFARLRAQRPLVHNITNYVAMTVSANLTLAIGAAPAMVHAEEEVEDFAAVADALVVNIGTLSPAWVAAMERAVSAYTARGKPWVLDPVAAGATPFRTATALRLLDRQPAVVRGNASEILSLAGASGAAPRGVDAVVGSEAAIAAAQALAAARSMVVAVTGAVDYVTDGTRLVAVHGGHPLMPLSTALGCALSAITAAFAAVAPPLEAAVAALAAYAVAGAEAGDRCPRGPGHLPAELADALYALDPEQLAARADIREVPA